MQYYSASGAVLTYRQASEAAAVTPTLAPRARLGMYARRMGAIVFFSYGTASDTEPEASTSTNNFAGPRVIWKGRINKRWWLRDDEEEDEAPKAIKKAAKAIEKLAEEDASPAKVEKILAPILNSAPRINWQAYFDEVAANIAAQNAAMREAHRIQLAYIVAQAARVAQDEDDIEALLLML